MVPLTRGGTCYTRARQEVQDKVLIIKSLSISSYIHIVIHKVVHESLSLESCAGEAFVSSQTLFPWECQDLALGALLSSTGHWEEPVLICCIQDFTDHWRLHLEQRDQTMNSALQESWEESLGEKGHLKHRPGDVLYYQPWPQGVSVRTPRMYWQEWGSNM